MLELIGRSMVEWTTSSATLLHLDTSPCRTFCLLPLFPVSFPCFGRDTRVSVSNSKHRRVSSFFRSCVLYSSYVLAEGSLRIKCENQAQELFPCRPILGSVWSSSLTKLAMPAPYAEHHHARYAPVSQMSRVPAVKRPESLDGIGELAFVIDRVSRHGTV